jgi:hypothetical protein
VRVQVTASIGVAALDAGSRRELSELLAAADAALYRAKACGRDQVQMISTSRGLSAVAPAAADGPGERDGATASDNEEPAPESLFLPSRAPRLAAAQFPGDGELPAEDEAGMSSTATTSAVAV